jgi:ech hydrogenase subunit A
MVAPTPVSALLHSSTMVKAGVYIILRFASQLEGTLPGLVLALIGGLTFLIASCIAISQSDAKKILAYSTIANLGLIVLCAGVGTYEALWAAALLIIFHAVAKCLLFLCVGVIEHRIHSRNIEEMSSLIISMPKLSIMMQIGMAGMFLAPFGMLISKWAVLKALVDFNPLLAVFVVFGSSASLFFWVKWMGTLISVVEEKESLEDDVARTEWIALSALSIMTIGVCGFFPAVSSILIEPYVIEICGKAVVMSHGNIVIMPIMLGMVMLFPLSFINYGKK